MTSTDMKRPEARLGEAFAGSDAQASGKSETKKDAETQARKAFSKRDDAREMADSGDDLYENMPI